MDFKEKNKRLVLYLFFVLLLGIVMFIFLKHTYVEMILLFCLGLVLGNYFGRERMKIVFGFGVLIWIAAFLLDPLTKSKMDEILNANFVGTFSKSFYTNGLLLISFVLGYFVVWMINKYR